MTALSPLATQLERFVTLMGDGGRITAASVEKVRAPYHWHRNIRNEHARAGIAFLAAGIFSFYYTRNNRICFAITTTLSGLSFLYCQYSVYTHHSQIREIESCCNATLRVLTQTAQEVQATLCRVINNKIEIGMSPLNVRASMHTTVQAFFDPKKQFFDNNGHRHTLNSFFNNQYGLPLYSQKVQSEGPIDLLERIHGCLRRIRYGWEGALASADYSYYFYINETAQPLQVCPF